eukprot:6692486-Alexandrium_andersonii.AAC.1
MPRKSLHGRQSGGSSLSRSTAKFISREVPVAWSRCLLLVNRCELFRGRSFAGRCRSAFGIVWLTSYQISQMRLRGKVRKDLKTGISQECSGSGGMRNVSQER